jgi:hypothetical protein
MDNYDKLLHKVGRGNTHKEGNPQIIIDFLEERIITRFGIPTKITTDNAQKFRSIELENFSFDYGVVLAHLSNCYL